MGIIMTQRYYLGIDLGTSGLRALLVGEDGVAINSSEMSYPVKNLHDGWSEQDPEDWIEACQTSLTNLQKSNPSEYSAVVGIGVSGHMHGAILLDESGKVLRPCILWNDTRSHLEAAKLDAMKNVRNLSGNIVFPGFTAPKLMWVAKNEPMIFSKINKVLLPASYLNFWLTGRTFSDVSDSSGTSWLEVEQRKWSNILLAASKMNKKQMPKLIEGCEVGAHLSEKTAGILGLSSNVKVVGGAGDNAASACGVGAVNEGDGVLSVGTSGVILLARESCSPLPDSAVHTFCHALPNLWYQMGVVLAATDCLNWLSSITNQTPENLTKHFKLPLTGPCKTNFFPYLSGERTPYNDAIVRAGFSGISASTDLQIMTQAILEGVAFALRDCLESLSTKGTSPAQLVVIGGGSASHFWLKTIATILNVSLAVPNQGEFVAALGAARLAIIGVTRAKPKVIMAKPEIKKIIAPDQNLHSEYQKAYLKFNQSYPRLKDLQ